MDKKLLVIAYHFPPIQGSSGVLRTLAFARYLQEAHWGVRVLTVATPAYSSVREENLQLIPAHVEVVRAWALDAQKHFSLSGRYPRLLAVPDRWQSWILGGVIAGLNMIRKERPSVLFSTYPIASAHVIGLVLQRLTGLPWVADFRDPMYQEGYPADPVVRATYARIERKVLDRAARIVVTTPGAAAMYRERYRIGEPDRVRVIPNGFDEEAFPVPPPAPVTAGNARLKLLHSGLIYPQERNPEAFFRALAALLASGRLSADEVEICLRASGNEEAYQRRIDELGLGSLVTLAAPVPYRDALDEMYAADGLIIFQAANCNKQIPAKLYEYFYVGKPILGITDPGGDTGALLLDMGMRHIASLENAGEIERVVPEFIAALRAGSVSSPPRDRVMALSRRERTVELARILDEVVAE